MKNIYHSSDNQIMEFNIPYTTYKNLAIGTTCHTTHKGTLNTCGDIVLGRL